MSLKHLFSTAQITTGALLEVYKVPASGQAALSSLIICNYVTTSGRASVTVATASGVAATVPAQRLYWNIPIPPEDTLTLTVGLTLAASGVVRVQADSTGLSFNGFGEEFTT